MDQVGEGSDAGGGDGEDGVRRQTCFNLHHAYEYMSYQGHTKKIAAYNGKVRLSFVIGTALKRRKRHK